MLRSLMADEVKLFVDRAEIAPDLVTLAIEVLESGREFSAEEFAANWSHRQVTMDPKYRNLPEDQRNRLHDLIDQALTDGLFDPPTESKEKLETTPVENLVGEISIAELEQLAGSVFHTTIDGSAERADYLAERARKSAKRHLIEAKVEPAKIPQLLSALEPSIQALRDDAILN
jgi:hypothetical protein